MWQPCAHDSGNKIADSAHGMGSGGSVVDAMVIGCLGVDRRVERFFSYSAIFHMTPPGPILTPCQHVIVFVTLTLTLTVFLRCNGVIHRTQKVIQGDDNGHVGCPVEVSLLPIRNCDL